MHSHSCVSSAVASSSDVSQPARKARQAHRAMMADFIDRLTSSTSPVPAFSKFRADMHIGMLTDKALWKRRKSLLRDLIDSLSPYIGELMRAAVGSSNAKLLLELVSIGADINFPAAERYPSPHAGVNHLLSLALVRGLSESVETLLSVPSLDLPLAINRGSWHDFGYRRVSSAVMSSIWVLLSSPRFSFNIADCATYSVAALACVAGDMATLSKSGGPGQMQLQRLWKIAEANGHLHILHHLNDHCNIVHVLDASWVRRSVGYYAAKYGHLHVLAWMFDSNLIPNKAWALNHNQPWSDVNSQQEATAAWTGAGESGSLATIPFLHYRTGRIGDDALYGAVENRQLPLVKWLVSQRAPLNFRRALERSLTHFEESDSISRYLLEIGVRPVPDAVSGICSQVGKNGDINKALLLQEYGVQWTCGMVCSALKASNFEFASFVIEGGAPLGENGDPFRALKFAAIVGSQEMVKLCLEHHDDEPDLHVVARAAVGMEDGTCGTTLTS